jgi:CelD/BcsL family acetyltransferase involved in cellulose biosynthesis
LFVPAQRTSGRGRLEVEVHDGQEALWDLWSGLDELHEATGVPVMARTSWLDVWADMNPEWTPHALVVRERGRGHIEAAALLARRITDQGTEIVGLGHGWAAHTVFPVRNARAARPLAKAIAAELTNAKEPTSLELHQLGAEDQVVGQLRLLLPQAELDPQLAVPRVALQQGDTLDTVLSRNLRRQLRKAHNRLAADGVAVEIVFDASLAALDTYLDDLIQIHRRRDHDTGRPSDLDDQGVRRHWRDLLVRHCRSGHVELALLRLDGVIAAYVIALLDGTSYRVFDGHCDTEFSRYSPGRVIEAAALERVMGDPGLRELDWMSGVAAEKILFFNAEEPRWRLVASVGAKSARTTVGAGLADPG